MVVGIVGKIGSGKSTVASFIQKKYGAIVISCDEIAKSIIENNESEYIKGFDGEIFFDEDKQEECRKKLHPIVFAKVKEMIRNDKEHDLFVVESALPNEDMFNICDKIITINSNYEDKLIWLKQERDYTEFKTAIIFGSQEYYNKFYDKADYKIENTGSIEELEKKVDEVFNEIYITGK